jgi:hypothetical protein
MKHLNILILLSLLLCIELEAKTKEGINQTPAVKALIQKIQNSSSDERRVAMNKLKIELRNMNISTRKKVMKDLKKTFAKSHSISGNRSFSTQRSGYQHGRNHQGQTPTRSTSPIRPQTAPVRVTPSTPMHGNPTHTPARGNPPRHNPGMHR